MRALLVRAATVAAFGVCLLATCVSEAELCETASSGKPALFYDGPSAGYLYDRLFTDTRFKIPYLDKYVPQGLATWSDYEGEKDMILVSSYQEGNEEGPEQGIVIGFDAATGVELGAVRIATHHAGGIAVFEELGWMFVSGPLIDKKHSISKYSLAAVKKAILTPESEPRFLESEGDQVVTGGASFLTSHGPTNTLWAGLHDADSLASMHEYKVGSGGVLTKQPRTWEVPKKMQGLVVTADSFIFSTSLGRDQRSNIWVVRRDDSESDLDPERITCFRAPSLSEGIAVYGNGLVLIFESGAEPYSEDDATRNVIPTWHRAKLSELEGLPPRGTATQ
jgi:hypothetical protein